MAENFAEQHRNITFSNNVTATLRMEPGMTRMFTGSSDNYSGNTKARIENRFGRLKMQPKQGRNNDTNNTDIDSVARFIKPGKLHTVAPLADIADFQETQVDLGSPLVKEVAAAAETYHDDTFFAGFFGNGYSGELGDTAIPFKATNVIAHGGTVLTKAKILAARELIKKRNAPMNREMPIWLLHPDDETDLLSINEYASFDYNGSKPLEKGEIKPWLGFRFMSINPDSDSLPTTYASFFEDAGATRVNPIIFPSGFHRGWWVEFMGKITQRDDKDFSWQYWGAARSAVARTDEDLAFIVKNNG
jgi:hypothetical protein